MANVPSTVFRTPIQTVPSHKQIGLREPIVLCGSCFSDDVGELLLDGKFSVLKNPFGVTYNPISIFHLLSLSINNAAPEPNHFLERNGQWFHYDFHSRNSAPEKQLLEQELASLIQETHDFLKKAKVIVLTFGTSMVYRLQSDKSIVANCHKVPQSQFVKSLLTVDEIVDGFKKLAAQLPSDVHFVLTVSPVRHVKETLQTNSISKALLRVACHRLATESAQVTYFPSFEIMMDDLRDYRFYEQDMLHPSSTAISYIWEKFSDTYFSRATKDFLYQWDEVTKSLRHRPQHPGTPSHIEFLKSLHHRLTKITEVDVADELSFVNDQLLRFLPKNG